LIQIIIERQEVLDTGSGNKILDTGYWILDTGYRILDTGYRILDTGYRMSKIFL
jgi:hypothetical protein